MEDGLNYLDEKERQNTIDEVVSRQMGLSHPITLMVMTCASKSGSTRYLNSTSP